MIPTWGTSTGRNSAGGIPSLLLDFSNQSYLLNGTAFAAFGGSPGITFSRGTNATLIDSTGQLTYAPSNQIPNSESFTATTWVPTGLAATPVISNATVAPDGTTTADSIVEFNGGAASNHRIDYSGLAGNAGKYAASVYLKAGTKTFARLQFDATLNAVASSCAVQVDLTDGTPSATSVAGNITSADVSVTDAGNGWYRVGLIFTISPVYVLSGGSVRIYLMQSLVPTPTYVGNGSNIFVWGAQFGAMTYETAPRTYNSTTPKNLLGFTEEFNNAAWGKNNSTVTTNAITDPNGYLNADAIIETAQVSPATAFHSVAQAITKPAVNITYTATVYAKYKGRQMPISFGSGASGVAGRVDLQTGTVVGTGGTYGTGWTFGSLTMSPVGNGWYRIALTATTDTLTTASLQYSLHDGTTNVYTGDGVSGVYLWGAQISDSASVDPYVYNPAAAPTSTAYYGPRFEYDPNFVYSIDNLIPYANPQDFSNASFWSKPRASAPATIATADPAGTYTAYKLTEDTATGTHLIAWQSLSQTVTAGVQYTISGYLKLANAARSTVVLSLGVDNGAFAVASGGNLDLSTGNVTSPTGNGVTVVNAGNGWYRWYITATAAASAVFIMRINLIEGGAISYNGDGTSGVYIWGAQLVTGAAPVPFYYYPYTPLGLLIEEARTNLLLNSATLSTQIVTTTAQAYTLSFYGTGTVTLTGTSVAGPLVGTGEFPNRASLTFTATAGALTLTVSGTVSNAQFEAGGFATSYIPTTGASATRSADVATMVGNNFSNWYNQTTGTLAVTFDASANGFATYVSASNGTITQNSVHIDNQSGNMRAAYRSGSTEVAAIGLLAIGTVGATNRIATAYAVDDFAASRNGVLGTPDTSGAVPVGLTQLNIGTDDRLTSTFYTSNHIKTISYFNSRLPNSSLQAITA